MPNEYCSWRNNIVTRIEQAKVRAVMGVNAELLALYWEIGNSILEKQEKQGWGARIIDQLSDDLSHQFPNDRGYSVRNLKYMRRFAEAYPKFPIVQVSLAQLENLPLSHETVLDFKVVVDGNEFVQVPLAQISWYHHISLLSKVKDVAERLFYIIERGHMFHFGTYLSVAVKAKPERCS